VLLFSLLNYRIVTSLGLDKLSLRAFGVVLATGAGPNLVRRNTLAFDWLRQVVTSKEEEQVRLRDAENARLRTRGTVTLWLQTGAQIVPVPFLVVDDLLVSVILGCTCWVSKIVPLSYSHNTGVNGPEEFKLIVQHSA